MDKCYYYCVQRSSKDMEGECNGINEIILTLRRQIFAQGWKSLGPPHLILEFFGQTQVLFWSEPLVYHSYTYGTFCKRENEGGKTKVNDTAWICPAQGILKNIKLLYMILWSLINDVMIMVNIYRMSSIGKEPCHYNCVNYGLLCAFSGVIKMLKQQ